MWRLLVLFLLVVGAVVSQSTSDTPDASSGQNVTDFHVYQLGRTKKCPQGEILFRRRCKKIAL